MELTLFEVNQEPATEDGTVAETEEAAEQNATETAENETTDAETAASEAEVTTTETAENTSAESEVNAEEETAVFGTEESLTGEEDSVQFEFDFASLDLSIFVETDMADSYQAAENTVIRMVVDGALAEATLADIQEGDMLVFFTDADEVTNIIVYRNVLQPEAVIEE